MAITSEPKRASRRARTSHTIRGEAVDVSSGGLGLRCCHFVPRMCEATLRVYAPSVVRASDESADAEGEVIFEQKIKVRRVTLIGREPTYVCRIGIYESLSFTPAIRAIVEPGGLVERVRELAISNGMRPMWQDGLEKARLGHTTLEEVVAAASIAHIEAHGSQTRMAA